MGCALASMIKCHNGSSGQSRSLYSTSLTISVQIWSFQTTDVTIEIVAHVPQFFFDSRVDTTMLELAQNNIKCALSQLTTCRPPPLSINPTFKKHAQCTETNEKTICRILFL